ncbi:MAG TPA: hypothetical protein ENI61_00745 [Ignavibacteria bacterium]|nr:hypothetical protein [Ignavibacteria bacterium]
MKNKMQNPYTERKWSLAQIQNITSSESRKISNKEKESYINIPLIISLIILGSTIIGMLTSTLLKFLLMLF